MPGVPNLVPGVENLLPLTQILLNLQSQMPHPSLLNYKLLGMGLLDSVHPQWLPALQEVEADIADMEKFVAAETAAGHTILPATADIFRAFRDSPRHVKVLIVGQDPYPTPGHAMGLSFSVQPHVRPLPRSLSNIFTELEADLGLPIPASGDLSPWAGQGVMLLNRCLTVEAGRAASHRNKGWEKITDAAITALTQRESPLVAMLWGRDAQALTPLLGATPIIASAHPSPLSARRGFFGSRPFSRANEYLRAQGAGPVNWQLPAHTSSHLF